MHHFVLLLGPEAAEEPAAATQAAIMVDYEKCYTKAGAAIRAGDALLPSATGVRIIEAAQFVEAADDHILAGAPLQLPSRRRPYECPTDR